MNILIRGYIRALKYLIDIVGDILEFLNFSFYELNLKNVFIRLKNQERRHIIKDKFFLRSLELFLSECQIKSGISLTGRIFVLNDIVHSIRSRYNFVKYVEKNPDIESVEIREPIFIVSFPRTGSSFLHCCLQEDKYWFSPEIWMQMVLSESPSNPFSEKDIKNIFEVQRSLNIRDALIGWSRIKSAHNLHSRNSEDILLHSATVGYFLIYSIYFNNMDKSLKLFGDLPLESRVEKFKFLKQIFQVQKKNYPGRRLLAMAHFPANDINVLIKIFPDARFITIHRDPIASIKSAISLLDIARTQYYHYQSTTNKEHFKKICVYYSKGHKNFRKQRELIEKLDGNSNRFIDLSFNQLIKDPMNCIKKIYNKLDINMSNEIEEKITNYILSQTEHSVRKHIHNKINISTGYIHEQFEDYYIKFNKEIYS